MNDRDVYKPIPKKLFDVLRWIQITLTGAAALYLTISRIWGLPFGTEIAATAAALSTFLGIYLKVDTAFYFDAEKKTEGEKDE